MESSIQEISLSSKAAYIVLGIALTFITNLIKDYYVGALRLKSFRKEMTWVSSHYKHQRESAKKLLLHALKKNNGKVLIPQKIITEIITPQYEVCAHKLSPIERREFNTLINYISLANKDSEELNDITESFKVTSEEYLTSPEYDENLIKHCKNFINKSDVISSLALELSKKRKKITTPN
jgi:hypothetical protein